MHLISEMLTNYLYRQMANYPFHNLKLLTGHGDSIGGTCFDHALRLKDTLQDAGFTAQLHEAEVCMTGEITHRLVKVSYKRNNLFVDTGTGWPTCYIAEAISRQKTHEVVGVHFRVIALDKYILVQRYSGEKWLDMNRISVNQQDEAIILEKFNDRYSQTLPFSNELRLSWLEGASFYRVAGNRLSIFESGKSVIQRNITVIELLKRIERTVFPELIIDLERYFEGNS